MSARTLAPLLASLAASCVVSTQDVAVENRVEVTLDGGGRADFFDASDPRLLRAQRDLDAAVGHPVQLAFHYAMIPRPQGQFLNGFFERDLGVIPRDLAELRVRSPAAFAWAAPGLRRIFFDYDGSREASEARFDRDAGVVVVELSAYGNIPERLVGDAVLASFRAHLVGRFRGVAARDVAPEDRALYVTYLTELSHTGANALEGDERVWSHPTARAIVDGVELEGGGGLDDAPALRQALRAWLLDAPGFFEAQRHRADQAAARAPEGSDYARAERAWAAWVMARFDDLTDAEQLELMPDLFVRDRAGGSGGERVRVLPGVRYVELWRRVVDRWLAAGAPVAEEPDTDAQPQALFEHAVCPFRPPLRGVSAADEGLHCRRNPLFRAMLDDPALFRDVVETARSREGSGLVAALTQRLLDDEGAGPVLELWRQLLDDPERFGAATRVMAAHFALRSERRHHEVYAAAGRLWNERPDLRGPLLYLIAAMDHPSGGNPDLVRWDRFAEAYGAPISREVLAEFLAQGWLAFAALGDVWPALGRGSSRADVILAALDRWIDDADARAALPGFPAATLRGVVTLVGSDRDELRRVRAWLERRVREHPDEEPQWRNLVGAISR